MGPRNGLKPFWKEVDPVHEAARLGELWQTARSSQEWPSVAEPATAAREPTQNTV